MTLISVETCTHYFDGAIWIDDVVCECVSTSYILSATVQDQLVWLAAVYENMAMDILKYT